MYGTLFCQLFGGEEHHMQLHGMLLEVIQQYLSSVLG